MLVSRGVGILEKPLNKKTHLLDPPDHDHLWDTSSKGEGLAWAIGGATDS